MSVPEGHPAMRGYDLDNLLRVSGSPDGIEFLKMHREHIRMHRDQAKAHATALLEAAAMADEILQRMATVLDQEGSA